MGRKKQEPTDKKNSTIKAAFEKQNAADSADNGTTKRAAKSRPRKPASSISSKELKEMAKQSEKSPQAGAIHFSSLTPAKRKELSEGTKDSFMQAEMAAAGSLTSLDHEVTVSEQRVHADMLQVWDSDLFQQQ